MPDGGRFQCGAHRTVDRCSDFWIEPFRPQQAEPRIALEAWQAGFGNRRNLGYRVDARLRRYTQQAQAVRTPVLNDRLDLREQAAHIALDHALDRLDATLVGHVLHVEPRLGIELRECEVGAGTVAGRRKVVFAGIRLDPVDEFSDRLDVDDFGIDGQHVRNVDKRRDRREIRFDVERQIPVERGIDAVRRSGPEQYRVAVCARLGDVIGRDIAACARPVFSDNPGVERLLHRLLQRACNDVDPRAGRKSHYDRYGFGRPVLRECRRADSGSQSEKYGQLKQAREHG